MSEVVDTKDKHSTTSNPPGLAKQRSKSVLLSTRVWDIQGAVVPRALIKRRRPRKVAIEYHRAEPPNVDAHSRSDGNQAKLSYKECLFVLLEPNKSDQLDSSQISQRESSKIDDHEDETTGDDALLDSCSEAFAIADYDKDWKVKYRLPIRAMQIKSHSKTSVVVQFSTEKTAFKRELIFYSVEDARDFQQVVERHIVEANKQVAAYSSITIGDIAPIGVEELNILVEITSAWDLMTSDISFSNPYVECYFNNKKVHETNHVPKTMDPVWTVTSSSLFLLSVDTNELFHSEGVVCQVMNFDKIREDEALGSVIIPPKSLYQGKGERLEFKIGPPRGFVGEDPSGYLAIRCRRATEYDMRFLQEYKKESLDFSGNSQSSVDNSFTNLTSMAMKSSGGTLYIKSIMTKKTRLLKNNEFPLGVKQYRVRPAPDPKRVDDTTWMTKEQLDKECLKESKTWVDSGSGRLGRLFVEVLGCDGLPNMDTGGFAGNKTDAFVCLVFEDTAVTTDVIDDTLSPRWMPWSKRAFIFHIYHSSSQLFLGVFDFDVSLNPTEDHDLIGRVSIDLSNLRNDTMYTLKYNIYTTARMSQRSSKGTVTVRLRLDIQDDRQMLLAALEPPPQMYVNCKKRKDFRVIRYTCTGKFNMEKYNMKNINSYVEELLALQNMMYYLQDACFSLILWRGSNCISILGKRFYVPIHSMAAFASAITLVERIEFIPSFCLFSIAWLLLVTMQYRRTLPDPWSRCKSYIELLEILVRGESTHPPDTIAAYENYEEATAFLVSWKKRIIDSEQKAAEAFEESVRIQEEYEREIEDLADVDTDLSAKKYEGISVDPFKPIIYPLQQNLIMLCRYVRHIKYVIFWEECYIAYWVVTGCLLLGAVFLFVPWLFLIKWSARAVAWTIFGPWMKLVDVFLIKKINPSTTEELEEKRKRERERRRIETSAHLKEARIKRENTLKLKAMKKYMFGKFITRVPVLKEDRYRDLPLPESTAIPHVPNPVPLSELAMQDAGYNRLVLPGQHLIGDMIPQIRSQGFTQAPIGQATAHPKWLDRRGPGGTLKINSDTTAGAYIWLGSLVVFSALLTLFGVPVLASTTHYLLQYLWKT